MSTVTDAADDYLAVRRALGFKLEPHGRLLAGFAAHLEQAGAACITTDLAVQWARLPAGTGLQWQSRRLGVVRGFARYLQAVDPATQVPPAGLLPASARRTIPYLYSAADLAALLGAAGRLRPPLHAATYQTMIALLAVTGLRVGEACRLANDDVDLDGAVLTIIRSKFGKTRLVPLHGSSVAALRAYAARRDQLCPRPETDTFFVSAAGTAVAAASPSKVFARLLTASGVTAPAGRRRPRLYDTRHSFAVATLLDWYQAGLDVQARLPLLSAYLGHVDPKSTYWYLQAAPELLALAALRLDQTHGDPA
jgi:integrase/recombinase XerD